MRSVSDQQPSQQPSQQPRTASYITPAPGQQPTYDLFALLRRTGRARSDASLSFPEERTESTSGVELLEDEPAPVQAPPAPVWAFLDGIQNQILLTYRQHRPVVLAFAAAGAAGSSGTLVGLSERIALVCAAAETEWVEKVNTTPPLPLTPVPDGPPPEVSRAVLEQVGHMRAACEVDLRTKLLAEAPLTHLLVLDGSLLGSQPDNRLAAVAKTVRTRYLKDESALWGLRPGWRSPIFKLPASGQTPARYSCYVRLHSAEYGEWSFGLIRIEAFYPEALDGLAARTLTERQSSGSGDPRWDRHLTSVATCERLLRARRPMVFGH